MNTALKISALGLFLAISVLAVDELELAVTGTTVRLDWEAVPSRSYDVYASPSLLNPSWSNVAPGGIVFSNVLGLCNAPLGENAHFYKVAEPDLYAPTIEALIPISNAVAVATNASVYVSFEDQTGIATNTLVITIAGWTNMTSASPYLSWSNSMLIFTPPSALGDPGAMITNCLTISDILGHTLSNYTWNFEIARPPVATGEFLSLTAPAGSKRTASGRLRTLPNVKPKAEAPVLDIQSVTSNMVVFSYETTPPVVTSGTKLVSFDAAYPFYRSVISNVVDTGLQHITAWTEDIPLTDILEAGSCASVNFTPADPGATKKGLEVELNLLHVEFGSDLSGTELCTNENLKLWLPECTWAWVADVDVAGDIEWGGLESFDASASTELTIHIKPEALFNAATSGGDEIPLVTPVSKIFGAMVGPVPVWVEVMVELNAGYEYEASVSGSAHTVVDISKEIVFSVKMREDLWSHGLENPPIVLEAEPLTWQLEGNARARVYIRPKLTILAFSLAGLWADAVPYTELEGTYQLNPLEYELGLYFGLASTLGIESRVWFTNAWGEKPEWQLMDERWPLWTTVYPDPSAVPVFSAPFPNKTVQLGKSVTLSGWASGIPDAEYKWYYNGARVVGAIAPEYTISSAQSGHAGTWSVLAYNSAGSVQTSCTVTVTTEAFPSSKFIIIDLSAGPSALSYPVSYLNSVPSGGWSDEYRTMKMVMRKISRGSFAMGSPASELGRESDETQHSVTLTKDYYIGVFEVTQKQWERVMGTWPSYFYNDAYDDFRPVEQISYYEIRENPNNSAIIPNWPASNQVHEDSFMGKLRAKTGFPTFDLPTEAQWEYACRAGTTAALNSGYNLTNTVADKRMDVLGRYEYNHPGGYSSISSIGLEGGTAKVGSYQPNAWNLYDMHGNVWEWCLDWYGTYPSTVSDPLGADSGSVRVLRGGNWGCSATRCRSAYRGSPPPGSQNYSIGFRVSLSSDQ